MIYHIYTGSKGKHVFTNEIPAFLRKQIIISINKLSKTFLIDRKENKALLRSEVMLMYTEQDKFIFFAHIYSSRYSKPSDLGLARFTLVIPVSPFSTCLSRYPPSFTCGTHCSPPLPFLKPARAVLRRSWAGGLAYFLVTVLAPEMNWFTTESRTVSATKGRALFRDSQGHSLVEISLKTRQPILRVFPSPSEPETPGQELANLF